MAKIRPMSKELAAMLDASNQKRKQTKPLVEATPTQQVLDVIASRLLRKADGRKARPERSDQVPAECCGAAGLRPTWHGRAS